MKLRLSLGVTMVRLGMLLAAAMAMQGCGESPSDLSRRAIDQANVAERRAARAEARVSELSSRVDDLEMQVLNLE